MSVCLNGHGTILLKKENVEEFSKEFDELSKQYDRQTKSMHREDGLFQFINYARHYFLRDFKELIEKHIDWIVCGQACFACNDEDGSVENPFPCLVTIEIVDGKMYEEELNTRLDCGFLDYIPDHQWFSSASEERNKETMEILEKAKDL